MSPILGPDRNIPRNSVLGRGALETLATRPQAIVSVYQQHALDASSLGCSALLVTGPGCTCESPPPTLGGTNLSCSWGYVLVGQWNPETGDIQQGAEPCG